MDCFGLVAIAWSTIACDAGRSSRSGLPRWPEASLPTFAFETILLTVENGSSNFEEIADVLRPNAVRRSTSSRVACDIILIERMVRLGGCGSEGGLILGR